MLFFIIFQFTEKSVITSESYCDKRYIAQVTLKSQTAVERNTFVGIKIMKSNLEHVALAN